MPSQTEAFEGERMRCPHWCTSRGCSTDRFARSPEEVLHTADGVCFHVPDGSNKPGRYPLAFSFELGCFSKTKDLPGEPFIMFGEAGNELRDVAVLDDLIEELSTAAAALQRWRQVMAAHYGEPA